MARPCKYSPEVCAWAVRRVFSRGERAADVARELGVSLHAIYNWRLQADYRKYAVIDPSGKDYGPRDLSGTRQAKILAKLRAAMPEICRAAAERHRNDED